MARAAGRLGLGLDRPAWHSASLTPTVRQDGMYVARVRDCADVSVRMHKCDGGMVMKGGRLFSHI